LGLLTVVIPNVIRWCNLFVNALFNKDYN